jgi:hypothetical protein
MEHLELIQEIQAVPQQTEKQWASKESAKIQPKCYYNFLVAGKRMLDMKVNWYKHVNLIYDAKKLT